MPLRHERHGNEVNDVTQRKTPMVYSLYGLLASLLLYLTGCNPPVGALANPSGGRATPDPVTLTIFAAASLTDAFAEIGGQFEADNPEIELVFNFAGSQQLAQQLSQGAPADVFASANQRQMAVVISSGRITPDAPQTFAQNRLVVIFPKDNPAGISRLQDLAKPGLNLVLAAETVPAGEYALDFLAKADQDADFDSNFKDKTLQNVVSYEQNVRAALVKVSLGEADAGIVYLSDIKGSNARNVGTMDIPDRLNILASYPLAPISDSPNLQQAQGFINFVLSSTGQEILANHGFVPFKSQ